MYNIVVKSFVHPSIDTDGKKENQIKSNHFTEMRKTETEALKSEKVQLTRMMSKQLQRDGDESITGTESETQVSAVTGLSRTDGHLVYFGEGAKQAPHPCTFWRNTTHLQMDCRDRGCCCEVKLQTDS